MKEVRIHGRGGQGSVTMASILAISFFDDGKYCQAFPSFGSERTGAPVQAFARVSDTPIRTRHQIYNPDYIIVQDVTLINSVAVAKGLKDSGKLIINTEADLKEIIKNFDNINESNVVLFPALKIAMKILGKPIVNTTLLGAFSAITGEVAIGSVKKEIEDRFNSKLGKINADAAQAAYDYVKGGKIGF
ncbi:MAG: pyruvate ferredoxin oxidoreductase subunit gamma [bacterium]